MSILPADRLTLTADETGKLLGLSRGLTYQAIHDGQIPSIRIGRRILVPVAQLERLLEQSDNGIKGTEFKIADQTEKKLRKRY